MNCRLLIGPAIALLLAPFAVGQGVCGGSESAQPVRAIAKMIVPVTTVGCDKTAANPVDSSGVDSQSVSDIPTGAELRRRIAVYEAAVRGTQSVYASDFTVAQVYARLASLYEDAGMDNRAEEALEHAISLLRRNASWSGELAEEINSLGLLHAGMGELRQAEREEFEALRLRQSMRDSLEIARSWNALAGLYFGEHKYAISREFAERALEEFSRDEGADVVDRISSRFNLSLALCYMKDCATAVPLLKEGIDIAKSAFKPGGFPVGEGVFLLGFAYWKLGDLTSASESMEQGLAIMKEKLGWGHPTYLNALGQYAKLLRESKRVQDAEVVERQIRRAEDVVDVQSLQTQKGVDGLAGLR